MCCAGSVAIGVILREISLALVTILVEHREGHRLRLKARQSETIIVEEEEELLPPAPPRAGKQLADVLTGLNEEDINKVIVHLSRILFKVGFVPSGFDMKVFVGTVFPVCFLMVLMLSLTAAAAVSSRFWAAAAKWPPPRCDLLRGQRRRECGQVASTADGSSTSRSLS